MSGAASKPSREPMTGESIANAVLESEGYAAFEYLGDGKFQTVAAPSRLCLQLLGESAPEGVADAQAPPSIDGKSPIGRLAIPGSVRLTERMPFLESFLPDAEECWNSESGGRADSGAWIERGAGGQELALEASAFRVAEKRILLIRNPQKRFAEDAQLLQKARDSALAHERLLREIQKKEILLHFVIHDLSQPLSAMHGCFSLLAAEKLSPKLRDMIEIGQRQSQIQEEMIREVLQAFSAELAAQEALPNDASTAPDLAKCAQEIVRDFSAAFSARGARIEFDAQADLTRDWLVAGDEARLRRIYTNLVENALRYSPADSTVTLGVAADGNYRRAYVDDEGPGLPDGESGARLFGLFAKGKEGGGKAGLGLYFCKITVERWGGAIGCENRPVRGTRFWFRLPQAEGETSERAVTASRPAADSPVREVKAEKSVKPLRLLIADDSPVNLRVTALLLENRGHEVTAVENGKEVLARMKKGRFDVVILDERMPKMGGIEAVRAIRKLETSNGGHIPAVLVTGNGSEEARRRSREAGVDAHITKPFRDEELFRTVEELCGAARLRASATEPGKATSTAEAFNARDLLKRVGGNPKVVRQVARIFLTDTPKRMSAIHKAIAKKDGEALAVAAHALSGSLGMLGASEIAADGRAIEVLGRSGSIEEASRLLAAFEVKLSDLKKVLAGIAGRPGNERKRGRKTGGTRARRRV
jgi:signal transduction histidine kinase/DNA-binding NarL/FixJ family response regulator